MAKALTVKRIERLRRVPGKYTDGEVKGLMLCVESETSAHWLLRFQLNHRVRHMGLGGLDDVPLAAARAKARRERERLADGVDPLAVKHAERNAQRQAEAKRHTFQQAAEACHKELEPGWSSAHHANEFIGSLERYAFPILGSLDVATVGKDEVLRVLKQMLPNRMGKATGGGPFWNTRPITADRVRNRIERILDFATVSGWRTGDNPARWRNFLDQVLPAPRKIAPVKHMRAVPFAEIPGLMQLLAADQSVGAQCLRFIILTACRPGSVIESPWTEVNLDAAEWVIPKERMKARTREHRVPLAPQAVTLLRSLLRESDNPYLFIGSKTPGTHINETTVADVLRRAGRKETLHGFRSSFSDWAHERTGHSNHAIELSLAHSIGNATEQAYRRGDMFAKRRKLMEAWATFCTTPPTADAGTVLLTMRGRA
jgi:integrase